MYIEAYILRFFEWYNFDFPSVFFSKSLSRLAQWSPHERKQDENAEDHLHGTPSTSVVAGNCGKIVEKYGNIMENIMQNHF